MTRIALPVSPAEITFGHQCLAATRQALAPQALAPHGLVMPAATRPAGYGGYAALRRASRVAEPGLSLIEYLWLARRREDT